VCKSISQIVNLLPDLCSPDSVAMTVPSLLEIAPSWILNDVS